MPNNVNPTPTSPAPTISRQMLNSTKLGTKEKIYLYNIAAQKCQIGDYKQANHILQFLTKQDLDNSLYLKALAGCKHGLKDYSAALLLYELVIAKNLEQNLDCLLYIADCLVNLHQVEPAQEKLTKLLHLLEKNSNAMAVYQQQYKRAKLLMAKLRQSHA